MHNSTALTDVVQSHTHTHTESGLLSSVELWPLVMGGWTLLFPSPLLVALLSWILIKTSVNNKLAACDRVYLLSGSQTHRGPWERIFPHITAALCHLTPWRGITVMMIMMMMMCNVLIHYFLYLLFWGPCWQVQQDAVHRSTLSVVLKTSSALTVKWWSTLLTLNSHRLNKRRWTLNVQTETTKGGHVIGVDDVVWWPVRSSLFDLGHHCTVDLGGHSSKVSMGKILNLKLAHVWSVCVQEETVGKRHVSMGEYDRSILVHRLKHLLWDTAKVAVTTASRYEI